MATHGIIHPSDQSSYSAIYRLVDVLIIIIFLEISMHVFSIIEKGPYLTVGLISAILFLLLGEAVQLYRSMRDVYGMRVTRGSDVSSIGWNRRRTGNSSSSG